MLNIDLTAAKFHDEEAAREWCEAKRWPGGVSCVHCGSLRAARMGKNPGPKGQSGRKGLFHCPDCRGQFTVRTSHVMESSHISMAKWCLAFHLMASSKKGVSAKQIERTLHVAYNSAWFMMHRIREAMNDANPAPLGGEGKVVEADEAYQGKREVHVPSPNRRGTPYIKKGKAASKRAIVALVERGGEARAKAMTGQRVTAENVREFLVTHASRQSRLHTDESPLYPGVGEEFAKHETVKHAAGEYVRGDVTTNTVEGFFGVFKRGFRGIYQHCGEQHFQRYLDEFTFRYNTRAALGIHDAERAEIAMVQGEGKRLTWRRINEA